MSVGLAVMSHSLCSIHCAYDSHWRYWDLKVMLSDDAFVGRSFFQILRMAVCTRLTSTRGWRSCRLLFLILSTPHLVAVLMEGCSIQVDNASKSCCMLTSFLFACSVERLCSDLDHKEPRYKCPTLLLLLLYIMQKTLVEGFHFFKENW